jgi:hypothetical protein
LQAREKGGAKPLSFPPDPCLHFLKNPKRRLMMKATKKVSGNGRYFLTLKVSNDVIKLVSVREISKIIVNKSLLEITVLLVSGDKDTVKFQSLEFP